MQSSIKCPELQSLSKFKVEEKKLIIHLRNCIVDGEISLEIVSISLFRLSVLLILIQVEFLGCLNSSSEYIPVCKREGNT